MTGGGVGVGPPATIGPSVGDDDAGGAVDGSTDGSTDGSEAGADPDGAVDGVVAGVALAPPGWDRVGVSETLTSGDADARATSLGGVLGATAPAVSATVARMRFNSPMATTRRAR